MKFECMNEQYAIIATLRLKPYDSDVRSSQTVRPTTGFVESTLRHTLTPPLKLNTIWSD